MNGVLVLAGWPAESGLSLTAGVLLEQLLRASLAGLVLAAVVWGMTRVSAGLPAALRCALWWAVSLKFVVTLIWLAPVELPLLPPPAAENPSVVVSEARSSASRPAGQPVPAQRPVTDDVGQVADIPLTVSWREAVVVLWLFGVCLGAFGIGRELAAARQLRRDSRPVDEPRVHERFATLRRRFGLSRRVALRVSDRVRVPLTIGWLRPVVLLPDSTLADLSDRELSMTLGHELMHIRRWDLWTAWVPRVARCLFFFHPLAVLAAREFALAREAACDAAVLRELAVAPRDYGRLLVRWRPSRAGGAAVDAIGCAAASSTFVHLKRRLAMLERPVTAPRRVRFAHWLFVLVLLAAVLPVRIIAQPPTPPAAEEIQVARNGTGTFERTVTVTGPVQLDVRTGSGSITVRPGPAGEVRVAGRVTVRPRLFRGAGEADELIRRLQADPPVDVSGGVVRVGYDLDPEYQRNVSISYDIEVPSDAEVRSRTGSGSQTVTGVAGPVSANAGSGSITVTDVGGPVATRTGSGSIRAEGIAGAFSARAGSGSVTLAQTAAGDIDVSTGSGSSTLRGINGALHVRAGSGRITVDGAPSGSWDLQTGSGPIRMRLPADAGFDLDVQTGSGRIETDHPVTVTVQGSMSRNRLNGQVRGGGSPVRARTGSGGVRIE